MTLGKAKIRQLVKDGLLRTDSYSILEQHQFGHYDLVDGLRDDGWHRFATIRHKGTLAYVPLHPQHDKLVFAYVDGCFLPVLVADDFDVTGGKKGLEGSVQYRHITLRDAVHPEYRSFLNPTGNNKVRGPQ